MDKDFKSKGTQSPLNKSREDKEALRFTSQEEAI